MKAKRTTKKTPPASPGTIKSLPAKKTRVFLVDDHPVVREGLAQIINHEPDLEVCGTAVNGAEALAAVPGARPDVVMVDLSLEKSSGLDLIQALRRRTPETTVLVLSMHDESLYAERALRAGARGYIMKGEPPQVLLSAIRQVRRGEVYLSEKMMRRMLMQIADAGSAKPASPLLVLSNRELQVFEMMGQGMRPRVIAQQMKIGVKTVEFYAANVKRKLNMPDMAELLQQAVKWVHERPMP